MPRCYSLLLISLFALPTALAQENAVATLTTDKEAYAYGEPIELRYTIRNEGEVEFTLWGSSSCIVGFAWDSLVHPGETGACSLDDGPHQFAPGSSRTWVWNIVPREHAVPESDGEQIIVAGKGSFWTPESIANVQFRASTTFTAPRYLGGRIAFRLAEGYTLDDIADVIEALNATPIEGGWEIEGTTVAEALEAYGDDERFRWMEIIRETQYTDVEYRVSTEPVVGPAPAGLSFPYPNPSRISVTLTLTPPHSGPARVELFDLQGRRVALLHEGVLTGGHPLTLTLQAPALAAGPYVVRATGPDYTFAQPLTVVE